MKIRILFLLSIILIGFTFTSCKKEVIDISDTTWTVFCPAPIDTFDIIFYNDHTINNGALGGNWSQSNSHIEFDIPTPILSDTVVFNFTGILDDETMNRTCTSTTGANFAWTATKQ